MTVLDRYIALALARGALLVVLILLPLFVLLDLVQQLEDVGTGKYGLIDALVYEIFMMPSYLLNLVPFTALLGTSIALGGLAHSNELTAMRASGISIARIGLATFKYGVLFMIFTIIIMEWVAPPLHQQALQRQSMALSGVSVLIEKHGFWIHQDNRFINVRNIHEGHTPADIHVFEFDAKNQELELYLHADHAEPNNLDQWIYKDLVLKKYQGENIDTRHASAMVQDSYLTKSQLQVLELPIASLSPSDLFQYLKYLQASGQTTERFELVFWQKASLPAAIAVMMLCSFPFVFGSLRSSSAGKRIVLTSIAGISFQLISQLMANLGLMLNLNPIVNTLAPILAFLIFGLMLMRRAF